MNLEINFISPVIYIRRQSAINEILNWIESNITIVIMCVQSLERLLLNVCIMRGWSCVHGSILYISTPVTTAGVEMRTCALLWNPVVLLHFIVPFCGMITSYKVCYNGCLSEVVVGEDWESRIGMSYLYLQPVDDLIILASIAINWRVFNDIWALWIQQAHSEMLNIKKYL